MPIRAGSGGLKYPLPSQSQLAAQQAAAAASAGGSAVASAYATNQRRASDNKQLRYNFLQAEMDRNFKAEQAFYDREHQMGGQLEAQDFRAGLQQQQLAHQDAVQFRSQTFQGEQNKLDREFRGDQTQRNQDFIRERDQQRFQQDQTQFERGVDAQIEQGIRQGKLELPPESQRKLQQLEAGKAKLRELDPAQQAEFMRKYEEEKRNIMRTAQQPGGVTATGQANRATTYYDPQTQTYVDTPIPGRTQPFVNGAPLPPDPAKVLQAKQQEMQQKQFQTDAAKYQKELQKEAQRLQKDDIGEDGKPKPLDGYVEQAKKNLKLFNVNEPAMPGQAPAGGAPARGNQAPNLPPGMQPIDNQGRIAAPNGVVLRPKQGSASSAQATPTQSPQLNGASIPANPQPWQYTPVPAIPPAPAPYFVDDSEGNGGRRRTYYGQ
jgi:hypothetical protein